MMLIGTNLRRPETCKWKPLLAVVTFRILITTRAYSWFTHAWLCYCVKTASWHIDSQTTTLNAKHMRINVRKRSLGHAHSRSLIRIFTGRILDNKVTVCFMRTRKTLIRLRGFAGWFETLLGALVRRYVFERCGSYLRFRTLRFISTFLHVAAHIYI